MELELTPIDRDADIYDVRKAVERVLHGPDLYDPDHKDNRGRKPNFKVIMGKSPAGRIHNGKAALRLPSKLGFRLFRWYKESNEHRIVVNGRALKLFRTYNPVPLDVKQELEKALYIDPDQDKIRTQNEERASQVRLRVAKVQFGVWYKPSDSTNTRRSFSVEYERNFLHKSAAYLYIVYEHKLICIDIGQRETEETNYLVLVKFSSIRKLGHGYDEFGQPYIIFDLYTPPSFEQESYNGRVPEYTERKGKYKTRHRISAIDDAHADIADYAHHLRVVLVEQDDLLQFEEICRTTQCEPRPTRVSGVDAQAKQFFCSRELFNIQCWINTMDWKNAFQIEAYLRCGLLNTHDLLVTLRKPIEDAIGYCGAKSSQFLRAFFGALKMRKPDEHPKDCLERMRKEDDAIKPLHLREGHILCHHAIITPSRILLEGPYATQSNSVIRRYQDHDAAFTERFIRVEFRDEDRLGYRWDGDVDGIQFLQQRVGGILRDGFEIGGRSFEFLAYSSSALCQHSVWFVSPFRDPKEGYVTAEHIRSSLGDFSKLLRTPSKYAARIAQYFTATDPSVTIHRDEWEEQPDLGPHTDGVGTISSELADKIWDTKCKADHEAGRGPSQDRIKPSAYQFRFLGYKGVVVVDSRLKGVKMRLRPSQCKFPVNDVEEAVFDIAQFFDKPNKVYLNRPAVMALEDLGVKKDTFIDLQEDTKKDIYTGEDSLMNFSKLLEHYYLGGRFHLGFILEQLFKLGLDFKDGTDKKAIKNPFFERLLRFSVHHSLREVKYKARIRVPRSYQLVGVADEGIAYIKDGVNEDDVFTLKPGQIYVCVQEKVNEPPKCLSGKCVISRNPVIHPGDVQQVFAVGEPPADKICFFRGLKNVVVLPAVGDRSLASCLAGGDLDGDTFDIYHDNQCLLPKVHETPAEYPPKVPWTLDPDRGDATVEDICDFIVEYIHSDVMGLLADKHIVIADQSNDGVFDPRCMKLARYCSEAVDYAKNGNPVNLQNIPKPLIRFKPDWHKTEVTRVRDLDYYVSDRALGYLFRNIELYDPKEPIESPSTACPAPAAEPISRAVAPLIRSTLNLTHDEATAAEQSSADNGYAEQVHAHYVREMQFICVTHTLVDTPDVRLTEEEVVLGTILANCVQPRLRSDRSERMRLHVGNLVDDIYTQIVQCEGGHKKATEELLRTALPHAWSAWCWAQHHRDREYIESFSLLVLRIVFDCLKHLGGLPETETT